MKRKDFMILGAAAVIAAIFSIILSGALLGSPKKNAIKVPKVDTINALFPSPQTDDTYKPFFNQKAIDPTQLIQIGNQINAAPFQGSGQ
jgi:hypothetical protein